VRVIACAAPGGGGPARHVDGPGIKERA
jgi:hypothetical protein